MSKELSGRELDAAVAEKVMGWTRNPHYKDITMPILDMCFEWDACGYGSNDLARYSESIEAAMQVVEKMRERGHSVQINGFRRWGVTFVLESDAAPTVRPCGGPSLPLAICRAALAVLGVKSDC